MCLKSAGGGSIPHKVTSLTVTDRLLADYHGVRFKLSVSDRSSAVCAQDEFHRGSKYRRLRLHTMDHRYGCHVLFICSKYCD